MPTNEMARAGPDNDRSSTTCSRMQHTPLARALMHQWRSSWHIHDGQIHRRPPPRMPQCQSPCGRREGSSERRGACPLLASRAARQTRTSSAPCNGSMNSLVHTHSRRDFTADDSPILFDQGSIAHCMHILYSYTSYTVLEDMYTPSVKHADAAGRIEADGGWPHAQARAGSKVRSTQRGVPAPLGARVIAADHFECCLQGPSRAPSALHGALTQQQPLTPRQPRSP